MGASDFGSLRCDIYVRMQHYFVHRYTFVPFQRFMGGVWRELLQRLFTALHGALGSQFRNTLQEGSPDGVACLPVPRGFRPVGFFSSFFPFCLGDNYFIFIRRTKYFVFKFALS
jgi:hypothetical protein